MKNPAYVILIGHNFGCALRAANRAHALAPPEPVVLQAYERLLPRERPEKAVSEIEALLKAHRRRAEEN